jgi:hypothetical protein
MVSFQEISYNIKPLDEQGCVWVCEHHDNVASRKVEFECLEGGDLGLHLF